MKNLIFPGNKMLLKTYEFMFSSRNTIYPSLSKWISFDWVSLFKFSVDTLPPQRQTVGPATAHMVKTWVILYSLNRMHPDSKHLQMKPAPTATAVTQGWMI